MKNILLLVWVFSSVAFGGAMSLEPENMAFTYQQNNEPWEMGNCTHKKSNVGLFEWDVDCEIGGKPRHYFVHLVVSYYPKTIHGSSAYEILYWVTDMTQAKAPLHDSSTIWVHNSSPENRMKVLEVAQGVEDDFASLRLLIKIPQGIKR